MRGVCRKAPKMPNEFLQFSDVTFYYDAVGSPIFDRLSFECHDG